MRLILTILLIGLFKADAQMVINASAPYRQINIPILNEITNSSGSYSLRKLRDQYTGAAIRIRKDTTGQPEQDIGFTESGNLDTAAIKNFLNLRSGFVTTWYDQSGNIRNATQTVQANQPRIANLGIIERQNSRVTIFFDGTNDDLRCDAVASTISGEDKEWTTIGVVTKTNTNTLGNAMAFASTSSIYPIISSLRFNASSQYGFFLRNTLNSFSINDNTGTYASNTQYLLFNYSTGLFYNLFSNNNSIMSGSYNTTSIDLNTCSIGALRRGVNSEGFFGGNIQEIIIYPSNKILNITTIQNNINTYYSIY